MNQLNEGVDYKDFVRQIIPVLSIDEYEAKTGSDDETVTLAFTVKGREASQAQTIDASHTVETDKPKATKRKRRVGEGG